MCDTHCIRITGRLGLTDGSKDPLSVEKQLRAVLPPEESSDFCHRMVLFGLAAGYLFRLVILALLKYLRSGEVRKEKTETRKTLGEALKARRTACKMTQEFVAEAIGVSRQAVSKWESGASDPSTSNLLALAKLYGVSAEDLLREAAGE